MKLDLDPELIRTSLTLWREAVDMTIPVHDEFKMHFMERRGPLLEGFAKTAAGLRLALRSCTAEGEDAAALQALFVDVEAFKK